MQIFLSIPHAKITVCTLLGQIRDYVSQVKNNPGIKVTSGMLTMHHCASLHKFLLYIKEIELRYNNRKNNLFDLLIGYMLVAVRL